MERYSDRAIAILNELHKERLDYESEYISLIDAANQLAAYEDTGREPEDIETILAVYEQDHKELRKYQDAERDGRLDVRPCSIGDTMYGIRNHRGVNKIQVGIVSDMHYTKNIDGEMRLVIVIKHVCRGLYGDKVFSTYAEAKAALFEWAAYQSGQCPELELMFAIPNGGYRNKAEAARLKAEGVKAGVPDIFLPVPRNGRAGLFVEMKYGKNRPSKDQCRYLDALMRLGYAVAVCYRHQSAIETITKYMREDVKL